MKEKYDKGSTVIGILAVIAVAVLVGILIGAKKDMIMSEMDTTVVSQRIQKVRKAAQEKMDMFKAKTGEEKMEDGAEKAEAGE